jgi:N-acetylglucosaminyl-diphospho-decaprenol L-rhamnosyltransferase
MHRLAIVIVNYKTPELVRQLLGHLREQVDPLQDVAVVVDNCSGDGSADRIEADIRSHGWSEWATVLRSPVNGGFSAGNNLGMRSCDARMYLLMNSDTYPRPGAVEELLRAAERSPGYGMLGPRLEDEDGTVQVSAFRFHTPLAELDQAIAVAPLSRMLRKHTVSVAPSDSSEPAEWLSFACILIRREVLEAVGYMDDGYFMYFEDDDFCRMAAQHGYSCLRWPAARVVHLRGKSSPVKRLAAARARLPAYYYESRSRYFLKWHGLLGWFLPNLAWQVGTVLDLLRRCMPGRTGRVPASRFIDVWRIGSRQRSSPS